MTLVIVALARDECPAPGWRRGLAMRRFSASTIRFCTSGSAEETVTREAGPVKGGSTVIAFVQDPDGYKIELIEKPS